MIQQVAQLRGQLLLRISRSHGALRCLE